MQARLVIPALKSTWSPPANLTEARAIQEALRARLDIRDRLGPIRTVAGVDVGYSRRQNLCRASAVVLDYATLAFRDAATAEQPPLFPYVPGYLSFRELPVILEALAALPEKPDLLLVDGQGYAHPRRVGIGAHLGLIIGVPSIGVAKSRLIGEFREPGRDKGDVASLDEGGERIGTVLRSRAEVRPIFVSPGHRVGHETAVAIVVRCLTRYRLPEPIRLADRLSKFPTA